MDATIKFSLEQYQNMLNSKVVELVELQQATDSGDSSGTVEISRVIGQYEEMIRNITYKIANIKAQGLMDTLSPRSVLTEVDEVGGEILEGDVPENGDDRA